MTVTLQTKTDITCLKLYIPIVQRTFGDEDQVISHLISLTGHQLELSGQVFISFINCLLKRVGCLVAIRSLVYLNR